MTDLDSLKIKPFDLGNVPAELQWCIYPEEQARGEVFLPETIYRIVLALRWILTYANDGIEQKFETWKVYWKCDDDYGFKTHIFLSRDEVKQYDDWTDKDRVLQEQTWHRLATLDCNNGRGVVRFVHSDLAQPYGGGRSLDGKLGVQRLLVDAVLASDAMTRDTLSCKGGKHSASRMHDASHRGTRTYLTFEVMGDGYTADSLNLVFSEMQF